MKKLLSALIVLAMIAMLTAVSFAASLTEGAIYIKEDDDDDYYTDLVDTLAPRRDRLDISRRL
ncbi:MAG: hypothetical protein J5968_02675 [Oscillospiraceae bacterium]|nr:hypothetical protein [Oscillospiraceae bacterium]